MCNIVQVQFNGIHKSYPYFYKPEFKEIIKKEHPWILDRNRNYPIEKYMINPISLLENEELIKPENFYYVYNNGHLLFDIHGKIVQMAFIYDYIGTPFTNEYCSLNSLLIYLKQHSWVVNKNELYIDNVPYYNNSNGLKKYIRGKNLPYIVILPDYNVLQEVYNIAIKKEPKYFSTYIRKYLIGDLLNPNTNIKDYLGIKQFYKNKNS